MNVMKFGFLFKFVGWLDRNSEAAKLSPEKDEKHYQTRGLLDDKGGNGKKIVTGENEDSKSKGSVWPKLYISLTSKEKEEDFLAMKGCKLPQRPKKRAKIIQRTLLVCSFFSSHRSDLNSTLINTICLCVYVCVCVLVCEKD